MTILLDDDFDLDIRIGDTVARQATMLTGTDQCGGNSQECGTGFGITCGSGRSDDYCPTEECYTNRTGCC